jgi:hypothetical protein
MGDKSNDSRISSEGAPLMGTLTGCKLEVEGSGEYGTVELPIWNTIGTGPEAIPYDGYSTADKIDKEMSLF